MIPERPKTYQTNFKGSNRRNYQRKLKRTAAINKFIKKIPKYSVVLLTMLILVCGIISGLLGGIACHHTQTLKSNTPDSKADIHHSHKKLITKRDVQSLIDSESFVNLKEKSFGFVFNEQNFRVDTSLDVPLQQFMLDNLDQSSARYIGIVVMDPTTGRILSMVSYDKTDQHNNPCIDNRFPAASIFKIVTAAAAIEKCNFNSGSILKYNGGKHTLYKSQLKKRNRYTNRITFRDSFAQSVNPVFGKIGALYLGKNVLENYAEAFGFNQNIDFEIPVAPNSIYLSDEPYQWAEIASGFNHETTLSPLHGALITSAILNQGRLVEPTIVDQITDKTGQVIYRSHLITLNQAITPKSAKVVNNLMEATIRSGTCRKAFRGYQKDQILSKLNIGGKSGSIDNKAHDARYDWFVGFAEEKDGHEKLVISVIVAHEKYISTRASHYARIAMKQYFRTYFAKKDEKVPFKTAFRIDD
jgi:peptidoglycan glycosyltransferase